jgi:hypothetical protein
MIAPLNNWRPGKILDIPICEFVTKRSLLNLKWLTRALGKNPRRLGWTRLSSWGRQQNDSCSFLFLFDSGKAESLWSTALVQQARLLATLWIPSNWLYYNLQSRHINLSTIYFLLQLTLSRILSPQWPKRITHSDAQAPARWKLIYLSRLKVQFISTLNRAQENA